MIRQLSLALAVLATIAFVSPAFAKKDYGQKSAKSKPNIVELAQSAGSFNTLIAAAKAAGLADALAGENKLTVFAPTDEAFAKLPDGTVDALLKPENRYKLEAILLYHVVPGTQMSGKVVGMDAAPTLLGQAAPISVSDGGATIAGAKIVKTDLKASNGVVHVIDSVMVPADIVDLASGAGQFNTLLAAAKAAGLAETLKTGGPFTVFAPTDEAFAKLPDGTVETLLKPENKDQLANILKYHVVPGVKMAGDVVSADELPTALGTEAPVTVTKKGNKTTVTVGGATVVKTDLRALNGVVHVIDTVMLPPTDTASAE